MRQLGIARFARSCRTPRRPDAPRRLGPHRRRTLQRALGDSTQQLIVRTGTPGSICLESRVEHAAGVGTHRSDPRWIGVPARTVLRALALGTPAEIGSSAGNEMK